MMTDEPVAGTRCSALQKCKVKLLDAMALTLGISASHKIQLNMKTPSSFTRNHFVSAVRFATVGTLLFAALAMAFVAIKPASQTLASSQARIRNVNKFRGDWDVFGENKRTLPGIERDRGPLLAAWEKYVHRAYPKRDIPVRATRNAIAGFRQFSDRAIRERAFAPLGVGPSAWELIGPSVANVPDILTFTGTEYVTSGRITALAIAPSCDPGNCRLYVGAAGGGVWRTNDALAATPTWTFVSDSFGTNAIGSLLIDPNDNTGNTIYAGTGEPNASGDSEAGVGIYKSTDGGNNWALVPGSDIFFQRSIGQMNLDRDGKLLVPIASGVRGVSSVTGGSESSGNGAHPLVTRGLYRCDGSTCTRIFTAPAPTRGSTTVKRDPTHPDIIYVNAFGGSFNGSGVGGIWRSTNNGTSFSQIFQPRDASLTAFASALERDEFDVTTLPTGATRMVVGAGTYPPGGGPNSSFWRSNNADTAANFNSVGGAAVDNYCTGQCWYDNLVVIPRGNPDAVYLGGSYQYGEYGGKSNSRAVLYSTNAGGTWSDVSWDATTNPTPPGSCCQPNPIAPHGLHPDQHALVVSPSNAGLFFEGSDGGLMRSSGSFTSISRQCRSPRNLTGADLGFCNGLLSRVPTQLFSLNNGLSTIQFQSLSATSDNSHLQGGNQDNGTFDYTGSQTWPQEIYGDGGQSGFNATNSSIRFNSFFGQFHDANFHNGDPSKWVIISAPIAGSPEGSNFYAPIIADPNPASAGTIFEGSQSVWRTQDWGGNQASLEANCPEFTTSGTKPGCGDFVQIGPVGATDLTASASPTPDYRGTTRAGGFVAAIERAPSNTGTMWVATNNGRVFISTNADAAAGSVTYTRLDTLPSAASAPNRFISGIYVDPANPNHAWISYSGYNANTPSLPGHVFEVTYNPATPDATWMNISYNLPDFPITDVVRDDVTGDLYASSDFGVMMLPFGGNTWTVAGTGLPMVEVAGLTIVPNSRVLYAATHGRSAWKLTLPSP